jgi:glycosyltransferase involved in cell wall biosynthesis
MKIAFHVYQFSFRGSEVALFDYALYNRRILNNISVIVSPKNQKAEPHPEVLKKFMNEFQIIYYTDLNDLENICKQEGIDAVYTIKYGTRDELVLKNTPTWVHCVFTTNEPHGNVYSGVSDSVSQKNNNGVKYPVVNHIVHLPDINSNFRTALNIPENATVLGRHGGEDTFNVPFVKTAIIKILEEKDDIYFIFAVRPHMLNDFNHKRVIYLESFTDSRIKRKFINTCDAMIHACTLGESFGLSILEFSFCNKPVITWNGGIWHKQHLINLRDKALIYNNESELLNIFRIGFNTNLNYNVTENFTADKIMKQFEQVFIKSLKNDIH